MRNTVEKGWVSSCISLLMTWCMGLILGHGLNGKAGSWLLAAPVALGEGLRRLSLSGGRGYLAAWGLFLLLCALPLLGLLWRGRQRADLLLPLASLLLGVWLFYLVNPTLLDTRLPVTEGWGMVGLAAVGSVLVAWAVLRLMKRMDAGAWSLLPEIMEWGAVLYVLVLGMGTVQQAAQQRAAAALANTGAADAAAFTGNTLEMLTVWKSLPSLLVAVLVMWGGDLLRALEADPFGEDTVLLAEQIARRCDGVVFLSLFVAVSCNISQMARFSRMTRVDVTAYFPVLTLALATVLRGLCRYFRRAKAVSDENDTII